MFPTIKNFCQSEHIIFKSSNGYMFKLSVGKDGFEPPNSEEDRFTVCCRWPLGYLPKISVKPFKKNQKKILVNISLLIL